MPVGPMPAIAARISSLMPRKSNMVSIWRRYTRSNCGPNLPISRLVASTISFCFTGDSAIAPPPAMTSMSKSPWNAARP